MHRLTAGFLLMLAVLGTLIFLARPTPADQPPTQELAPTGALADSVSTTTASRDDRDTTIQDVASASPEPSTQRPRKPGYVWDRLEPGIAASEADGHWLDARGFPDIETYRDLMLLSIAQLERRAMQGDAPAQGVLAYRLAKAGADPAEVTDLLLASAAAGSLYALKAGADAYTALPQFRDLPTAYAYNLLRLQYGDHAAITENWMISTAMDARHVAKAHALAAAMRLELERRNPDISAYYRTPRPGYIEFMESASRNGDPP